MATIKDIARLANVSHGTVSNVLNGKGNVSVEKIKAVEAAAKQLGYSLNAQAKQLRKPSALTDNIAVILPNITEKKYADLFSAIEAYFEPLGYHILLFLTDDSPYKEQSAINTSARMRICGAIAVSCCPDETSMYSLIYQSGAFVIFLERGSAKQISFFSFNYKKIGKDIADYIKKHDFKNIAIVRSSNSFIEESELETSIINELESSEYICRCETLKINDVAYFPQLFHLCDRPLFDFIFTTNENIINGIKYVFQIKSVECPAIVALTPFNFPLDDIRYTPYFLNYTNLGIKASAFLYQCLSNESFALKHKEKSCKVLCDSNGFHTKLSFPSITKKRKLNFLLVKGSASSALDKLIPEFEHASGISVNAMIMPPNEMYDTLANENAGKVFDLFRSNLFMLPIYAKEKYLPLSEKVFADLTKNMIPELVNEYAVFNNGPYGIPYDIGMQILIYRKDLFDDPILKRMFYEKFGGELNVPTNFDEFNNVSKFFTEKYNPDSPVEYGTSSSLTTTSGICTDFEMRYRAFGGTAKIDNSHVYVDKSSAQKAMQNYIDHFSYSLPNLDDYWGGSNVNNFMQGKTAMEILYYNFASNLSELKSGKTDGQIGFASIPGKRPAFIGASLSISRYTNEPEAALEFISWACSPQLAEAFTYLGGVSPHKHIYENEKILLTYPGHQLLKESIPYCSGRGIFNYVNDIEYEKLLGLLIRNTINQTLTFDEAFNIFSESIDKYIL